MRIALDPYLYRGINPCESDWLDTATEAVFFTHR